MARQLTRLVCQPPGWTSTLSTINDLFRASVLWSAPSSSRYRGESLSWYKPWLVVGVVGGGVHSFFLRVGRYRYPHPAQCEFAYPPRLHRLHNYTVLSIVQSGSNRGRDSRWQIGGCGNIHGVKIRVPAVVQTGGKVTCRNSRTARNDSDQLGLDPVVIHVSQPLLVSLSWFNPVV